MPETLGERLRRLRHAQQLSLLALKRRTGISHPHLSRLETGIAHDPKVSTLWTLADVYGVSLDELVGREVPEPPMC